MITPEKKLMLEKIVGTFSRNRTEVVALLQKYSPAIVANLTKVQQLALLRDYLKSNDAFREEFVKGFLQKQKTVFKNAVIETIFAGIEIIKGLFSGNAAEQAEIDKAMLQVAYQKQQAEQRVFLIYSVLGGVLIVASVIVAVVIYRK